MGVQARVVDQFDLGVVGQIFGDLLGVGAVPVHAQGERLEVLQGQPGVEGLHDGADELGRVPADVFGQVFRADDRAAQHGGVAGQELGDAQAERCPRRTPCGRCRAAVAVVLSTISGTLCAVRHIGDGLDVGDEEAGVARASRPRPAWCARRFPCPTISGRRDLPRSGIARRSAPGRCGGLLVAFAEDVQLVTMLSPGRAMVKIRLKSACEPDPAVTAASPPSSAARRCSSTAAVGVLVRP